MARKRVFGAALASPKAKRRRQAAATAASPPRPPTPRAPSPRAPSPPPFLPLLPLSPPPASEPFLSPKVENDIAPSGPSGQVICPAPPSGEEEQIDYPPPPQEEENVSPPPFVGKGWCLTCAKRVFWEDKNGVLHGPSRCARTRPGKSCDKCQCRKGPCRKMPPVLAADVAALLGLSLGKPALERQEAFNAAVDGCLRRIDKVPAQERALWCLNRNTFRLLNELRETNGKEPLQEAEEESFGWETWEDQVAGKAML